ncbi:hypothetical protein MBRA1_002176 [Malassezia brasiliensis]|uniref:Major facilitator superfamily (MFS) profile domain-containing protein n=1 Tax=Malassezia brasiliensis TaxID=1821822 RepID=A0AAF0DU63_9BASI|nr:hypothetical protein MBRA1_002176 [Malassezia brasiliensis]
MPTTRSDPPISDLASIDADIREAHELQIKNVYHNLAYSFIISATQMFSVAGLGIAAFTARDVAKGVNASESDTVWFLAAYSLTGGVFVLIAGSIGDVIGPKNALCIGWLCVAVFALISGFAVNAVMFDVMRGLAGIGNALMIPNAVALLARAYPPGSAWKNFSFALLGFFAPSGFVIGGAIGAGMAHLYTWKWGYWLYAIICFAFCVMTLLVVPHRLGIGLPHASLRQFDYLGSFFGVAGLLLFAFSWNQADLVGWETTYTYVLLIVGVVMLVAFVLWESYVEHPVLPPSMWTRKGFTPVILALLFGWMSFGIFLYYAPEYLMTFRDVSGLNAVGEFSPVVVCGFIATMSVAVLVDRFPVQYFFMLSSFGFMFGNIMFANTPMEQTYWAMAFPAFSLVALGPDLSFTAGSIVISNTLTHHEQAKGGSMVNTVVLYGAGLGMGFGGCIEHYIMRNHNDKHLAFRSTLFFAFGLAALAFLIVVFFIRDERFRKKKPSEKEMELA